MLWNGADALTDPQAHARRLRYLGHQDALKASLTVRENLDFYARIHGGDVGTALAALNLAHSAAIIDTDSREVEYVKTGRYPYGAAITRDGEKGLISNEADGTVSVIDLASASEEKEITVGPHLSHPEGMATDQTEEELAAELIREAALLRLRQEIPHALAVDVREIEPARHGVVVRASLLVATPAAASFWKVSQPFVAGLFRKYVTCSRVDAKP